MGAAKRDLMEAQAEEQARKVLDLQHVGTRLLSPSTSAPEAPKPPRRSSRRVPPSLTPSVTTSQSKALVGEPSTLSVDVEETNELAVNEQEVYAMIATQDNAREQHSRLPLRMQDARLLLEVAQMMAAGVSA